MSTKPSLQSSTAELQEPERHAQVVSEQLALPAVCGVRDVARVLGVSVSMVHKLRKAGALRVLECQPRIGRVRYSGAKLAQWANGELDRPRYFGGVRRKTA